MKTEISRLIAAIAKALNTASIAVILDGQDLTDAARGSAFVRISPLDVSRGDRNTRADAFISITCFSSSGSSAFSHLDLADACITALGKSLTLYAVNGTSVVGVAVLAGRPKLQNLGMQDKMLQCVLDLDYIYNT